MKLSDEYPYLDKFLRENIYKDIEEEYTLYWVSNIGEEDEIMIVYKNGKKEFTPISEIDGSPLPIPGPFSLSLFSPYDADKQLRKEIYCKEF